MFKQRSARVHPARPESKLYKDLLEKFYTGDVLAASRLMSAVERGGPDAEAVLDDVFPRTGRSWRIGLTGGTGSGKSTLVDALTAAHRGQGHTVGIVAEDPTSPFSGGAVLGDRIRMASAVGDAGVFIRSVASRGSETGLSDVSSELADVLDAFGRDVILLETIGVGQIEHRVRFSTDTAVVVLTPEAGDDVQSLKSGLMETGDVFVVNKADRPGADRFAADVLAMLQLRREGAAWAPPVVSTVATSGEGIAELDGALASHRAFLDGNGRLESRRREGLRERVRSIGNRKLVGDFWRNSYMEKRFSAIFDAVAAKESSPYAAANRLIEAVWQDGLPGAGGGESTE
jgi:LAO/AO transport system kinase